MRLSNEHPSTSTATATAHQLRVVVVVVFFVVVYLYNVFVSSSSSNHHHQLHYVRDEHHLSPPFLAVLIRELIWTELNRTEPFWAELKNIIRFDFREWTKVWREGRKYFCIIFSSSIAHIHFHLFHILISEINYVKIVFPSPSLFSSSFFTSDGNLSPLTTFY